MINLSPTPGPRMCALMTPVTLATVEHVHVYREKMLLTLINTSVIVVTISLVETAANLLTTFSLGKSNK